MAARSRGPQGDRRGGSVHRRRRAPGPRPPGLDRDGTAAAGRGDPAGRGLRLRLAPAGASGSNFESLAREGRLRAASVSDYRELARRRLPNIFFEYIDGGSYAEATLARNVADMEAIALRQRVMRDMSQLDMSITTLGQAMAMPVALAPVGMAGMYARRGEVQAARAAAKAGIPMCLSAMSVCSPEEVSAPGVPPWFQL